MHSFEVNSNESVCRKSGCLRLEQVTYDTIKDVDIVSAATGFASLTGRKYILVFHEALYIPELDHTLINPNQLSQFHMQVQDNTYHAT